MVGVLGLFYLLISLLAAHAATAPKLVLTWHAKTYAPTDFGGKVLPIASSNITAFLELVDGGRVVDLSGRTIYWYANDALMSNKIGTTSLGFRTPDIAGGTIDLRVQIPNYDGATLTKTVEIPVTDPLVVIDAPFPGNIAAQSPIEVHALPYFFNVTQKENLAFRWMANGQAPEQSTEPDRLVISLGANTAANFPIALNLRVNNSLVATENAAQVTTVLFK